MYNNWDSLWKKSRYSSKKLRIKKAEIKTKILYNFLNVNNYCIVDVGCGGGYITKRIMEDNNCKVIGVDSSKEAITIARDVLKDTNVQLINCSAQKMEIESNTADLVVCFGCLEHIKDINIAINEIKRILKPNGYLFVFTSNIKSIMYLQRKIQEHLKTWKYGYQKNWDTNKLKELLEKNDFSIERVEIINDIVDFKMLSFIDKAISMFYNNWGRYIAILGRLK